MLVAISQKNQKNQYGDWIDSLNNNYVDFLERFGIKLIFIPNTAQELNYYFDSFPIEGIILSGGEDINPKLYGEDIEWPNTSDHRDKTEKKLLETAITKKLPVLGICRGMQFLNVFFGGKLIKSIKNEVGNHPPAATHSLEIVDERAIKFLGEKAEVNSYHNQGITLQELSSELKPFAKTEDGIIEGVFHPRLPIAGIQWHPERRSPNEEFNEKIFRAFANRELFWGRNHLRVL